MQSDRGLGLEEKRQCSSAQRLVAGSCYTISAPQLSDTVLLPPYTGLYCALLCYSYKLPPVFVLGASFKPYTRHMQPTASLGHLTSCLVNHDMAPVCSL